MINRFEIQTNARNQFIDITNSVADAVRKSGIEAGLCVVFTPHTSAAITINENADPAVKTDMIRKLSELFPKQDNYGHMEGNSDSHLKSSIVGCSETLIVEGGKLLLGTWQGVYFCEFDGRRTRQYYVKIVAS